MHWQPENVNRLLVLRNAVTNDRWDETWQGRMKQAQLDRGTPSSEPPGTGHTTADTSLSDTF